MCTQGLFLPYFEDKKIKLLFNIFCFGLVYLNNDPSVKIWYMHIYFSFSNAKVIKKMDRKGGKYRKIVILVQL